MHLKSKLERGFTLIELLAVLAILGIILMIAVPVYSKEIAEAEEEICEANRAIVKKDYEMNLTFSGNDHSSTLFNQYLQGYDGELCPDEGIFSYVEEENTINCSIHSSMNDPGDEEVPWL
ncbi:pilus assembly FimT family protein [Ornithinibacillus californiensis]|uniref:pilus assembly FimT family protein n=1 Tax=Ornithinibacillus californiensis TaxID=161536 RepID=UPI00064E0697|nr:type II secretion system protein [Ornithinibacillus californiensis]